MSYHIFLSHSSADKLPVEELARRLEKEGIEAWLDKWHLFPGDPWQPSIEKALAESEALGVGRLSHRRHSRTEGRPWVRGKLILNIE